MRNYDDLAAEPELTIEVVDYRPVWQHAGVMAQQAREGRGHVLDPLRA